MKFYIWQDHRIEETLSTKVRYASEIVNNLVQIVALHVS